MAFVRTTKTASGATAVQVVEKRIGRLHILRHVGSAHTEAALQILRTRAAAWLATRPERAGQATLFQAAGQQRLEQVLATARVSSGVSLLLRTVLDHAYHVLGFDTLDGGLFRLLVYARIIEPVSKLDSLRIIAELGATASSNGIYTALPRYVTKRYREEVAKRCLAYRRTASPSSLQFVLYDVTTLYFETTQPDDDGQGQRKLGYSKDHRNDCPQVVVGLLVDQAGFPLDVQQYDGNTFEGTTLIPALTAFKERLGDGEATLTVVADAGMLSADNLTKLVAAGFDYIVAARTGKLPESQLAALGIDVLKAAPGSSSEMQTAASRLILQYSEARARLDRRTRERQFERAHAIVAGTRKGQAVKFVTKTGAAQFVLNTTLLEKTKRLEGLKGYLTSHTDLTAEAVVAQYHTLWRVEQSFRMSKSDLRARPIFHRKQDAIDAHLTIVMAALAVSRFIQEQTGLSAKRVVQLLRPLRSVQLQFEDTALPPQIVHPMVTANVQALFDDLRIPPTFTRS